MMLFLPTYCQLFAARVPVLPVPAMLLVLLMRLVLLVLTILTVAYRTQNSTVGVVAMTFLVSQQIQTGNSFGAFALRYLVSLDFVGADYHECPSFHRANHRAP
jgi:competence protein ComGC